MMKFRFAYIVPFLLGLSILISRNSTAEPQKMGVKESIAAEHRVFEDAFSNSNAVAMAAQYTKGAELILRGEDIIRDTGDIQFYFKQFLMNSGATKFRFQTTKLEEMGDWANDIGTFIASSSDGKPVVEGQYIALWNLQGDKWKIHVHIFHGDRRNNE